MTERQQRDNSGVIFANDRKERDTDPDGKGSATIAGVEYWVSSWVNRSKSGVSYKTLRFTPKAQRQQQPDARPAGNSSQPRTSRGGAMADHVAAARSERENRPADASVIGDEQHFDSGDIPF